MTRRSDGYRRDGATGIAWERAQSHVVGVVLLLALTAVAMGTLTATVGSIVEDQTSHADATNVVSEFESTFRPLETTGTRTGTVSFASGRLSVVDREMRLLNESGVIRTVETDALVFEANQRRVAYVGGAIVRGKPRRAWMESTPPISSGPDVVIVGAPALGSSIGVSGTGGVRATLSTNVSHRRVPIGRGGYSVAVETTTPDAFERYAQDQGQSATVRDLDGDGVPSAVLEYPGNRTGYLVVHEMHLEVGDG